MSLKLDGLSQEEIEKNGLGGYLVNAQSGCNGCHTFPALIPGRQVSAEKFLAVESKVDVPGFATIGFTFLMGQSKPLHTG